MRYIEYAIIAFQVLIFFGGCARVGAIIFQKSQDEIGNGATHNKRIRNTILMIIFANGAIIIRYIIVGYLS